jgi:GxxExxY protein
LGPGYLEKIYNNALKIKLKKAGLKFETEKEFTVYLDGDYLGKFRCDFLIEEKVILEIKAISGFLPKIFQSQVISYLKASKLRIGLLINFGNTSCQVQRIAV